ncbi:hypothetical protein Purlil1_10925 [Purpureocillium lilacinum]|uniref:Uncharacterized protein n=1 Tax=Purpureocillium lilacinum TaxID=33203 RepID=A0ABR0BL76_PURLI|nr:hypothetical protein Purlil1_10925 [Purpureocillium lilacinum]
MSHGRRAELLSCHPQTHASHLFRHLRQPRGKDSSISCLGRISDCSEKYGATFIVAALAWLLDRSMRPSGVPPFGAPNGGSANRLPSSVDTADIDNGVLEGWPEAHLLGSLDHPSLEAMICSGSGPGERSRKLSRRSRDLGPVLTSFGTLSRLQDDLSTPDSVGTTFAVVMALKVLL